MRGYRFQVLGYSLIFFLLSTVNCTLNPTFAAAEATPSSQAVDIGYSKLTAASPFYFLKTIREDLELKFAGTLHVKLLRELEFATRRIREAKTLIPVNQDLVAPTLENYGSHLNKLNNIPQGNDLDVRVREGLNTHIKVLMQLYDRSSNPKAKMAIRAALYKLIQRPEILNTQRQSVCNLFYREASQSSLNQTEKYVLTERAKKCQEINK